MDQPELLITCRWKDCNRNFAKTEPFIDHLENEHLPKGKAVKGQWKCLWDNCNHKPFQIRSKLLPHLRAHDLGFPPSICSTCIPSRTFPNPSALREHDNELHPPLDKVLLYPPSSHSDPSSSSSPSTATTLPIPAASTSSKPRNKSSGSRTKAASIVVPSPRNPIPAYALDLSHLSEQLSPTPLPCKWDPPQSIKQSGGGGESDKCSASTRSLLAQFEHLVNEHLRYPAQGAKWRCCWNGCTSYFNQRQQLIDHIAQKHVQLSYRSCPHCTDAVFDNSNLRSAHIRHRHPEHSQSQPSISAPSSEPRATNPKATATANRWPKKIATPSTYTTPMPSQAGTLPSSSFPNPSTSSYYS